MKVFLSHSSVDTDLASRLSRDLQSANVDVWLDQWQLRVGEPFVQSIERGLDEADFAIVLLTPASVSSDWVSREWRHKVEAEAQTRRVTVLPVRGEPCEIPDFLAQRSHADISGGSYPLGFRYLLTMLRHYSEQSSVVDVFDDTLLAPASSPEMIPVVTPIALEVAGDLIPIFEPDSQGANRFMDELAPGMRDALRAEFGFPFPGMSIRGNDDMTPHSALIMIDEVPEVMLEIDPGAGFTTWDPAEYLCLALQSVLRRMAPLFLDIDVTWRLVDALQPVAPELVARTVPQTVSYFELTDILQRLTAEEIGIGDIGRILETLAQREPGMLDTVLLAERVRHGLRGQITLKFSRGRDELPVLLLDPEIEILIGSAILRTPQLSYLELDPPSVDDILAAVRAQISLLGPRAAGLPILLNSVEVRPYMRNIVKLEFPSLHVLSRLDLDPDVHVQTIARIQLR